MTTRQELYMKYKGDSENKKDKDKQKEKEKVNEKEKENESEKEYDSDCECDLCVEDEVWDYHPDFPQISSTSLEELFQFRSFYFPHQQQPVDQQKVFRTLWALKKHTLPTRFAKTHTPTFRFNQLYRFHNLKQDKSKYQVD